jgi:putative ABC transport system substrate-binding protein
MKRRDILRATAASAVVLVNPLARAQSGKPITIGWLNSGSQKRRGVWLDAFKSAMADLGWKEGAQVVYEARWAEGSAARLPALLDELRAARPAVVVAAPRSAVTTAAKGLPGTPIVQASGTSPVDAGLAASLGRPGGNVTGITNLAAEVPEKYVELLLIAMPTVQRVGFVVDPTTLTLSGLREMALRSVARRSIQAHIVEVVTMEEFDAAAARLAKDKVQAFILFPGNGGIEADRERFMKLAFAHRWPIVAGPHEWAEAGALLTYGIDLIASYRRAAYFVDRILRGAKPGDLPIEQPTRFELVVNARTARQLGISLPGELLLRADRVIE